MNGIRHAQWLVILTSAAMLLFACGGEDQKGATAGGDGGSQPPAVGQVFTVRGCVQAAREPEQFVLTTIQIDLPELGPVERNRLADRTGMTEWSWLKLEPGDHGFERYLGERVTVTGVLVDSGGNTIGTAGTWGYETPSGDKSRAASDEHYAEKQKLEMGRIARQSLANGTAAEIRVERVRPTGEKCLDIPEPEVR